MVTIPSQREFTADEVEVLAFPRTVNYVVGTTATKITKPTNATILVMSAVSGSFQTRNGDFVLSGMPGAFVPAATITNGSGGVPVYQGQILTIQAPPEITIKGYTTTDALMYYFL
jgi:hypothetical protein